MSLEAISVGVAPLLVSDYTQEGLLVPGLRERNPAGILNELSQRLHAEGCVPALLPFYHAALNQELLGDSGVESGVAFPHARLGGVRRLCFAYGRAPEPVNWGCKGATPVEFVFLLAIPATDGAQYLHLLASLARLGQQAETLAQLRSATEPREILEILSHLRIGPN